MTYNLMK